MDLLDRLQDRPEKGTPFMANAMLADTADDATLPRACDYQRVAKAVDYVAGHYREQPTLEQLAAHVGLSPHHFQRLFTRWAGMSPKAFLQALTLDHARSLLRDSASVLDTAYEVGLSGPGRLHDLFVSYEAMTPGDYKQGGEGLEIRYGFHDSPFGLALLMVTDRGLCGLAFADPGDGDRDSAFADMAARWPKASYVEDEAATAPYASQVFSPEPGHNEPLKVIFLGTDFQVRVWGALLQIPRGHAVTYGDIAAHLGDPKAVRAVGTAVGRNPMSYVVPCHRVLRKGGGLGGYHWGLIRKRAIIGFEAA